MPSQNYTYQLLIRRKEKYKIVIIVIANETKIINRKMFNFRQTIERYFSTKDFDFAVEGLNISLSTASRILRYRLAANDFRDNFRETTIRKATSIHLVQKARATIGRGAKRFASFF